MARRPELTFRSISNDSLEFTDIIVREEKDYLRKLGWRDEDIVAATSPFRNKTSWLPTLPEMFVVGAELDRKLIGWFFLLKRDEDNIGIIESVFLRRASRGKKYSRPLIRHALKCAREHGIELVEVHVVDPAVVPFWQYKIFKMPPNLPDGWLRLDTGRELTAKSWRLRVDQFAV